LKLVVEQEHGGLEAEHVFVAPFVVPISAAATNAMCIALMSASFQNGLQIVDSDWTTSGWLYSAEVFRLRHDGALVLLPRNGCMPVQEVGDMTTFQHDAFYNTFLCLRAAVRAMQPNYDLVMHLGDATGKTWVLVLGHARVTLEPGMRLPLCLDDMSPDNIGRARERRALALYAAFSIGWCPLPHPTVAAMMAMHTHWRTAVVQQFMV
jgi:hypothetical protein